MRRGNMLVATLVTCAILSLVLLVGLAVLSMEQEVGQTRLEYLQLEQLHRTAVADALSVLNQQGHRVSDGASLIEDAPVAKQHRQVMVQAVKGQDIFLETVSTIKGGSKRTHHVQLWCLAEEERLKLHTEKTALRTGKQVTQISNQWLRTHATNDMVICSNHTEHVVVGSGGAFDALLQGNLLVAQRDNRPFKAVINSPITSVGTMVFKGDVYLSRSLIAKRVFIDGQLQISSEARLEGEDIFLSQEVPYEILQKLSGNIYMPLSEKTLQELEKLPEEVQACYQAILPLPKYETTSERYYYFMIQQID